MYALFDSTMIKAFLSQDSSSNAYLLAGTRLAVIDPGFQADALLPEIARLQYNHYALINTHCHMDHVAQDARIIDLGFELMVHADDAGFLEKPDLEMVLSKWFGRAFNPLKVSRRLKEGGVIDLDGLVLEVLHTPGHTPGGICLYEPESKSLFTGDTVFSMGVGRTDLPGGDSDLLSKSLTKLLRFSESRGVEKIYPGHGPDGDLDDLVEMCGLYV